MIQLFPDQEKSIEQLRQSMRRHKSVLLQGETGSGKSVMAAYMIAGSRAKNLRSAFVVPRRDLLHQMAVTFNDFDISHSFVAAGKPFNPYSPTHICTTGTLVNKMDKIDPHLIFFDECHYGAGQLEQLITYYQAKGIWVIGLSASPEKPDGRRLDEFYQDMIVGPSIRQLIDLGRLSDYRLFAPSQPDLSQIKTVGGDYAKGQLANYMEHQNVLIGNAVDHYRQLAMGKLNITFCTSIKHSEMTADAFRAAGIPSVHMDGETPEDERRRIAQAFARRELLNICSVDLMTFGYDLAAASGMKGAVIESTSDLRPTKSRPLQRQKNGRVLRWKSDPAIFMDHAGNAAYHGLPCDDVEWSLEGRKKKARDGDEALIPVRSCPHCYFVHRPMLVCPSCGHQYEIEYREVEEIAGTLTEVDRNAIKVKKQIEQGRAETLEDLVAVGKSRRMKNPIGWARHVFESRKKKQELKVSLHAGGQELDLN